MPTIDELLDPNSALLDAVMKSAKGKTLMDGFSDGFWTRLHQAAKPPAPGTPRGHFRILKAMPFQLAARIAKGTRPHLVEGQESSHLSRLDSLQK